MDRTLTAGRIGKLFGAKGELSLTLYDVFPRDWDNEKPVFVEIDAHKVSLFFEKFVRRGVRGATVLFADIDTETRALELVGREFSIRVDGTDSGCGVVSGVPSDNELYLEDFVGWDVELGSGLSGRITAFLDSEFNPLFEVEMQGGRNAAGGHSKKDGRGREGKTELIPAAEEFIVEVDEKRRVVVFELPEGLLSLNE